MQDQGHGAMRPIDQIGGSRRTGVAAPDTMPPAAWLLGYAGAMPFIAGALASLFGPDFFATAGVRPIHWLAPVEVLRGYGVAILAFMGGVHWGLAMAADTAAPEEEDETDNWRRFSVSVLPALWAWPALYVPPTLGCLLLAVGFGALLVYDVVSAQMGESPNWYAKLRTHLTLIVVICLLAGAFGG